MTCSICYIDFHITHRHPYMHHLGIKVQVLAVVVSMLLEYKLLSMREREERGKKREERERREERRERREEREKRGETRGEKRRGKEEGRRKREEKREERREERKEERREKRGEKRGEKRETHPGMLFKNVVNCNPFNYSTVGPSLHSL